MNPEIGLLAVNRLNWPVFRDTLNRVLNKRPDTAINTIPIDFSDDAKVLLNIAAFFGWSLENPLGVLRTLPPLFMEFLTYQFFIACDQDTWEEFNPSSNITIIKQEIPDGLLIISTGTLNAWYQSIVCNLERNWKFRHDTRVLFCKLMLCFERERGLRQLFEGYKKVVQPDQTFLLEKK
jgi:hypothetical protein